MMSELFKEYAHIIIFLHVLGAFIWVGGMIAVRIAVHPVLQKIDNPKSRLGVTLQIIGRLFALVAPFILLLLITGLIMAIALDGHHGAQKMLYIAKESIWSVMTLNYLFMFWRRLEAWRLFQSGNLDEAKAKIAPIAKLLIPINIALGVFALWLGVSLRGF